MSILRQNELSTNERTAMIRQAFWLEYATLAWMTIEAAVAIASGVAANSLTLVAFGIDSVIELASTGILVWRLTVELRHGMFAESAERKASRIVGGLLFVLAAYVVASAGLEALDTPRRGVLATRPRSMRARCSDNVFPFPP
jgi:hypothetical protein